MRRVALFALSVACSREVERVDGPVDVGFDRPHRMDGGWLGVQARDTTCALRTDGGIWCWSVHDRQPPAQVARFPGAMAFATAGELRCALVSGRVWCKGGTISVRPPHVDEPVAIPEPVIEIAGAFSYVCARGTSERVYCWEPSRGGVPVPPRGGQGLESDPLIAELPPVQALALGAELGCAISEGRAICFGGVGPREVARVAHAISVGRDQRCVAGDDDIACTLLLPTSVIDSAPRATTTHHAGRATALAGTEGTTCAIIDRRVACWHGAAGAHDVGVTDATQIAVGDFEACARTSDGALYCWAWTYGRT